MRIDVFQKMQADPESVYLCINTEHAMPLVPVKNIEDEIELRCFAGACDFKVKPGLDLYNKVLKKYELLFYGGTRANSFLIQMVPPELLPLS